jgi:hypothetical protein
MATTSISGLPETVTIDGATVAPVDFSGSTYKVSVTTLGAFITQNATTVSATGTVIGGNLSTTGTVSANTIAGTTVSVTGGISGSSVAMTTALTVNSGGAQATAIVNGAANSVGNIGSTSSYFNRVFAQATTALYADLAEVYEADADYSPGTVVVFGGDKEVTLTQKSGDPRVAGVISENPSYLMNNGLTADHRAIVALTGRVPTLVHGPVVKGDMMVSAGNGYAQACSTPAMGTVIGKALENFNGKNGKIEIVVGRM